MTRLFSHIALVVAAFVTLTPLAEASPTTSVREFARVFASFKTGTPYARAAQPEDLKLTVGAGSFLSGQQSSCVDLVEAKATKSAAKMSVEAQGFYLDGLTLDWASTEILNVDSIRAVITDAKGDRAVLELPVGEVIALVANEQSSIQGPAKIVTNDPARVADPKFTPCGLAFGGINWLDASQELKVVLTVLGSSEAANGDLSPVEVSVETSVLPATL